MGGGTSLRGGTSLHGLSRTLDYSFSSLASRVSGLSFFRGGWGHFPLLSYDAEAAYARAVVADPTTIRLDWKQIYRGTHRGLDLDGRPVSTPFRIYETSTDAGASPWLLPHVPPPVRRTRFLMLRPETSAGPNGGRAVVHLPATGDHTFWRRGLFSRRLLHHGITSILLEGAYYHGRIPEGQSYSYLNHVADLFMLGRLSIQEAMVAAAWAEAEIGPSLAVAGLSMGGVHACMAASWYPRKLAAVPCMAPHAAAPPYVLGAMATAVDWEALRRNHAPDELLAHCASDMERLGWNNQSVRTTTSSSETTTTTTTTMERWDGAPVRGEDGDRSVPVDRLGRPLVGVARDADLIAAIVADTDQYGASSRFRGWDVRRDARVGSSSRTDTSTTSTTSFRTSTTSTNIAGAGNIGERKRTPAVEEEEEVREVREVREGLAGGAQRQPWRGDDRSTAEGPPRSRDEKVTRTSSPTPMPTPTPTPTPMPSSSSSSSSTVLGPLSAELYEVMLRYTDVTRFPVPLGVRESVVVGAKDDAYVSPHSVQRIADVWSAKSGSPVDVRWVPGGHVTAFLSQWGEFQRAIRNAVDRMEASDENQTMDKII